METLTLENICAALGRHEPRKESFHDRARAAVALLLKDIGQGPEIFLIRRAIHESDPWSGDLGFPGGRVEPGELPEHTAVRETLEEVGINLSRGDRLGQLDDLAGAHLPILVSCYVFGLSGPIPVVHNHEVLDSFWFPLEHLRDPGRHHSTMVRFHGEPLVRPAIHLLDSKGPVLWGITYRLINQFLEILGHPLPKP